MYRRTPRLLREFCGRFLPAARRAADGRRIMDCVAEILASDRSNSFSRFRVTSATVAGYFESVGAAVETHVARTGGAMGTGRWVVGEAQDVVAATIDIVTPTSERLADYADNPFHVVQWTAATPPDGVEADLVVVESDEQLADLGDRVAGKVVLTRLDSRGLFEPLARRGAAAVIFDKPVPRHPNDVAWTKFGWGGLSLPAASLRLVGMAVSERQGARLRRLAGRGTVRVRVKVDVREYVGSHDVVSGLVRGRDDPQDEVWALAHSYEPGAHDNASGVAVCVEIARVIEKLIAEGRLPRPRRTIRLLAGYECYGFFHYLEHVRRLQTPLAGVCIDCVGAKPSVCDGRLAWHDTIPMSAGFVNRLGSSITKLALAERNPGYRLVRRPFTSTCDTLIGDPKYGFPCPYVSTFERAGGKPYDAYHSSADTLSTLSTRGLAWTAASMGAYLYYLADMATPGVLELARAETTWALGQLRRQKAKLSEREARYRLDAHRLSLDRLRRWLWGGDRSDIAGALASCEGQVLDAVAGATRRRRKPVPRLPRSARRVPRRTALLTPTLENTPKPIADAIRRAGLRDWSLFWADGNRTVAQIADAVACEHGSEVLVDKAGAFFDAHAELGYVELVEPDDVVSRTQLLRDLRALGLRSGMDVMVHSSLSAIGHVSCGAETVIDALLAAIGKRGTLLLPSFNHSSARVFNPLATPTTNGAIPDAGWQRPDAVRSVHPSHAVAAIGPKAEAYCRGHIEAGIWGPESPIGRLVHWGGHLLSLGVEHFYTTAQHVAEVSVPCRCIGEFEGRGRIIDADGSVREVPGLVWRDAECPVSMAKLTRSLDRRKLQTRGKVGRADCMLVAAHYFWRVRRGQLKRVCPTCKIRPRL